MRVRSFALIAFAIFAACGDDAAPPPDVAEDVPDLGPPPFAPDSYCPGSPSCLDEGDGTLHAGAASVRVTPVIGPTTDIQTVDVNGNGEFNPADGDMFEDRDDNGRFDGVWIAGFGNSRPASGSMDDQWVRAIALRTNQTTIVLASIDCIGYFSDDVDRVREAVADLEIDYVAIGATHTHEARDTMGIWGPDESETGVDTEYMDYLVEQAEMAIRQAVADLRVAHVQYAATRLADAPGGARRYVSDSRDPWIVDDELRLMRFEDASTNATIATLVNWSSHPQYIGDDNQMLSSDFVHWLRQGIEEGVMDPAGTMVDGIGGIAVFFNGAVGCQIGNERMDAQTWDGRMLERFGTETAQVVGEQVAYFALQALGPTGGSITDETAALGFRNRRFDIDVQNRGFHIALISGLFATRQTYNWDPDQPLVPDRNEPDIRTEVGVIDIGRATMLTIPGELDPALFVGGYDGSYTPNGVDIVNVMLENPPDLSAAPGPPYLREQARGDAEYIYLLGLTNDEIGYFVPEFDYELNAGNPYIDDAPGDHYEETVSVGIDGWPRVKRELENLLAWQP